MLQWLLHVLIISDLSRPHQKSPKFSYPNSVRGCNQEAHGFVLVTLSFSEVESHDAHCYFVVIVLFESSKHSVISVNKADVYNHVVCSDSVYAGSVMHL